ncbi:hypothetical protein PSUB009319_42260 [Ralstonia sp. SET104]|nr:hypothetical protein PSUB009319_42260 [Ralstonia sp. SET104]
MSALSIRPIVADDLRGILTVQQACYGDGFLESDDALASRWARSPAMCLVALGGAEVVGYLLSHAWHAWEPPKLHMPLPTADAGDAADVLWFVHDMAIAPAVGSAWGSAFTRLPARQPRRRACANRVWWPCKAPTCSGIASAIAALRSKRNRSQRYAPSMVQTPN